MTIPEAAQLVVQAGGIAIGGEVFVLDMGEPVKIMDLAYNLIKLSGLQPNVDIKIEITGLRPGEKLYEELSYQEEADNRRTTLNSKIFISPPIVFDTKFFRTQLDNLKKYSDEGNVDELRRELNEIIFDCVNHKQAEDKHLA
jgi:FlaA1/EpsC-like NDP-sugar epimerase